MSTKSIYRQYGKLLTINIPQINAACVTHKKENITLFSYLFQVTNIYNKNQESQNVTNEKKL